MALSGVCFCPFPLTVRVHSLSLCLNLDKCNQSFFSILVLIFVNFVNSVDNLIQTRYSVLKQPFMCYSPLHDQDSVGGQIASTFGLPSFYCMLPSRIMSLRNEWCLPIPLSIFSLCRNQKHIYKHSFALPSLYVNPIHFSQSICSVYTHRLRWGTKGPL